MRNCSAIPPLSRKRRVSEHTNTFCRRLRIDGEADNAIKTHAYGYIWPENVVMQMRLANDLDLKKISARRYNAYIPHRFETFTVRLRDITNTTVLLFRTGRAVLAGTRAPEYTYQGAHRMRIDLATQGKDTAFEELRLVNQVYNTMLNTSSGVDLGKMYVNNMDKTEWIPDMFPGLKYTDQKYEVKLSMFDTKRLVVMGSKNAWQISQIFSRANQIASQYPDDNLPVSGERFEYRKGKKLLACSDIAASEMILTQ